MSGLCTNCKSLGVIEDVCQNCGNGRYIKKGPLPPSVSKKEKAAANAEKKRLQKLKESLLELDEPSED